MKYFLRSILTVTALVFSSCLFSQIKYEKGYYINNQNVKIECLIKNVDWRYNPTSFEYKLNEQSNSTVLTIDSVSEFGILNSSKFVRAKLQIDRSADASYIDKISESPQPQWTDETLFLRVEVEGNATLFSYESESLVRFFYCTKNGDIKQLVYKPYKVSDIAFDYNTSFHNQLFANVNCGNTSSQKIGEISYDKDELKEYFTNYNQCKGEAISYTAVQTKRKSFSLKILAGLSYSSFTTNYTTNLNNIYVPGGSSINFDSKINGLGGIEAEYILPYNKNQWSIFIEPSYFSYSSSGEKGQQGNGTVDYSAIAIAAGGRHYFFLTDDNKLFVDLLASYNSSLAAKYYDYTSDKAISNSLCAAVGAGLAFNKLSAELRYNTASDFFDTIGFSGSFKRVSLVLKYELF
jgi:hypothetical protein